MKKHLFTIALAMAVILFAFKAIEKINYKVDLGSSQLKWTGYHLAKSYQHWGYVNIKSGDIRVEGDKIVGGTIVVDMTSLNNQDLEKEKDNTKLVNHLKSDDFFAVADHPEAKLTIKSTSKKSENIYETVADITIRGITKEIKFDTKVNSITEDKLEATAKFDVDRTEHKVLYGWSIENAMLSNAFTLEVKIVAKK